jgi:hypothetical protein
MTHWTTDWLKFNDFNAEKLLIDQTQKKGSLIAVVAILTFEEYKYICSIYLNNQQDHKEFEIDSGRFITLQKAKKYADNILSEHGYTVLPDKLRILI